MKNLIIIALLSLSLAPALAQKTNTYGDRIRYGRSELIITDNDTIERRKYGKSELIITKTDTTFYQRTRNTYKEFTGDQALREARTAKRQWRWDWDQGHWQGMSLMYSGLVRGLNNLSLPSDASWMTQSSKSIGVDINFVDLRIFGRGCFGIITGLGLEVNNFRFDKNVGITNDPTTGYIIPDYSYDLAGINLDKSKLTTAYLQVPLLFEFQFGKGRHPKGWVNFGVVGGIRVNAHTKVKSSEFGIQKNHSNLNIPLFHYGIEASVGYWCFGLRAKYYPQPIFKPGEGPQVEQVNIGLTIAF